MPTAASWTTERVVRPLADLRHLLAFRSSAMLRSRRARVGALAFVVLTAGAAVGPAYLAGAGSGTGRSWDMVVLLPSALVGLLLVSAVSAVASGGGRELLPRDQAAIHPISPTTDHLGALLLAPLNIAWIVQAWALLAATAYGLGPRGLLSAQIGMLLWLAVATAAGQVIAWTAEAVRRGPHGIAVVRCVGLALVAVFVGLQLSGRLGETLDRVPTTWLVARILSDAPALYVQAVAVEVLLMLVAVVLGALAAHLAARRMPHDELRGDSGVHPARRDTGTLLASLVRVDRASVWRAVPMRRGLAVLAIGPGAVALAGGLPWAQVIVLPGLVAAGGALLFGVNAWCLDARGVLWRESLPVPAGLVFAARAVVLAEFLVVASGVTLALASLRAGVPTPAELSAVVCTWLVVVLQVVGASLRWSARNPHAVDLRSARATPAPPLTMVGYSTRLAATTTLTGLLFSALARTPSWQLSLLVAGPFVLWSALRLLQARDAWVEPRSRARVVMTVAG